MLISNKKAQMIRVTLDVDIIFSLNKRFIPKLFNLLSSITKILSRRLILHLLCQCTAAPLSHHKTLWFNYFRHRLSTSVDRA
jgi:hypothetical protein